LLQALPRTPLWRRLEQEGRLYHGDDRETNIEYALPYDEVIGMWRTTIAAAYDSCRRQSAGTGRIEMERAQGGLCVGPWAICARVRLREACSRKKKVFALSELGLRRRPASATARSRCCAHS
jgi:hypothetical protein